MTPEDALLHRSITTSWQWRFNSVVSSTTWPSLTLQPHRVVRRSMARAISKTKHTRSPQRLLSHETAAQAETINKLIHRKMLSNTGNVFIVTFEADDLAPVGCYSIPIPERYVS